MTIYETRGYKNNFTKHIEAYDWNDYRSAVKFGLSYFGKRQNFVIRPVIVGE